MKDFKDVYEIVKTIDEQIRNAYEIGYNRGFEDAKEKSKTASEAVISRANVDGMDTAWECVKRIFQLDSQVVKELFGDYLVDVIVQNYSAQGALALLEKYDAAQAQKSCGSCKFTALSSTSEPCKSCNMALLSNWEEREETDLEFQVGDELVSKNGDTVILLSKDSDAAWSCISHSGLICTLVIVDFQNWRKTGRNFPYVLELLEKLKDWK